MSRVFLTVLNMSISAGWIVLAVLFLRFVLKKAPKWLTVALWGLVAIRLICPFSIESALSLIPSAETVAPSVMVSHVPSINTGLEAVDNAVNPVIDQAVTVIGPQKAVNTFKLSVLILSVVWLAGVAAMLVYALVSCLRVKNRVRTAVLLRDNIYQCETVASPFVLGIIRPKIYMPFGMSEQDAGYVIAHEMAHIGRRDHLWKPLGFLLLSLHWFNPLMWLGYVLLCRDIELACDEKVIGELDREQRADYSRALLTCSINRRTIAACPLAFGEVGVKQRVSKVLSYKKPAFWIIIAATLALAVAAVCLLTDPKPRDIDDLDDRLKVFLDMRVAEHHSPGKTEDNFMAVSYDIMKVEEEGDRTTVYAWILCMSYICENGKPEVESGAHTPTVITVEDLGEEYALIEYWQPRDGSYYTDDIKEKFPRALWPRALNSQETVEKQKQECLQSAMDYFGLSDPGVEQVTSADTAAVTLPPARPAMDGGYINVIPMEGKYNGEKMEVTFERISIDSYPGQTG